MESRKKIKSIFAGHYCLKTSPCIHEIMIKYTDGTISEKSLNGKEIWQRYGEYLQAKDKKHFSYYERSNCFKFFNACRKSHSTSESEEALLETSSQLRN